MKKRAISVVMAAVMTVFAISPAAFAGENGPAVQKETGRTMTEEWFGENAGCGILNPDTVKAWEPVVSVYEETREDSFSDLSVHNAQAVFAGGNRPVILNTEAVSPDEIRRQACIHEMEQRMQIQITDAVTTVQIKNVAEENGQTVLDLYEWTFFDYIDLAGDGRTTDVSGYGVDHRLTLEKTDAGYEVVSDSYDEGDLTGMKSSDYRETEKTTVTLQGNHQESFMSEAYTYDPDQAAAYADRYVKKDISGGVDESYYNPAYKNMNENGGDCTNYVSQCMYAGGFPMDDKWFYENEDYYTAAWSTAREHYPYMSGVGKAIENPGSKDIKKGSPVYYSNGDHIVHTTICVGENSAGTPIINSHNNDYYHVRWNYWGESTTYYTVQIPTSGYKRPSVDIVVEPGSAGDVDADGRVTANDALLVLKNVVGLNEFSDEESVSADLDLDGEITANDALQILKKVVGLA